MKRAIAATLALSTGLALSACSSADLVAQSVETAQSGPAMDVDRVSVVLDDLQSTITNADEAKNGDALAVRLSDPALRFRQAQYRLAAATNSTVSPLTVTKGDVALTNTQTWPRTVVNIASSGEASLPTAFFLVQDSAREPYKLISWARILGGTVLTIPAVNSGSPTLEATSTGFVATPEDTITGYVNMLNEGVSGNDTFAADEFANSYLQDAKTLNDAVQAAGSVTAKAEATDYPITGVLLEDGSALVTGTFTYTLTYSRTIARSTMRLGGTTAAVAEGDDDTVKGTATAHYLANVIFHVPAESIGGKITVVGAERIIENVTMDPSSSPD